MKYICNKLECTACGACENICPSKSIVKQYQSDGTYLYVLNEKTCLGCNLCKKVCPNISTPILQKPINVFAGWSNNISNFETAASGGIATELYFDALAHDMFIVGVKMTKDFKCQFELTNEAKQIELFKNSKYTFSHMDKIYNEIIEKIQKGHSVLFIGMPCQVAAVKNFANLNRCVDKLILVDLACHGLPAETYFQQHLKWIEGKHDKKVVECYFRDPQYGTKKYAMTVYEKKKLEQVEKPFYCRYVDENDLYQIGYHSSIIYRENCYTCKYAQVLRIGDITLGDYYGLGEDYVYEGEKKEVSFVFANTKKGLNILKRLEGSKKILLYERPLEEPLLYQKPLNSPANKPKERECFIREYRNCQSYEKAAEVAFGKIAKVNMIKKYLFVDNIKTIIKSLVPRIVIKSIRKIRKRI